MSHIKQYLESTYLKTPELAKLSVKENNIAVDHFVDEAIHESFKLVMLRPEMLDMAKKKIVDTNSKLLLGTVIDFPNGTASLDLKLAEAKFAISNHADELDFVINYEAFKNNEIALVKDEVIACASLCIRNKKAVKFIIEVAALNDAQIIKICTLIKNTIIANFKEDCFSYVYVKSSTGFYETRDNLPNGATAHAIVLMLENAFPLPIKASGGIRNLEDAQAMIKLGVKRIGTSSAKEIANGLATNSDY